MKPESVKVILSNAMQSGELKIKSLAEEIQETLLRQGRLEFRELS
jgi:hypothetical protein